MLRGQRVVSRHYLRNEFALPPEILHRAHVPDYFAVDYDLGADVACRLKQYRVHED